MVAQKLRDETLSCGFSCPGKLAGKMCGQKDKHQTRLSWAPPRSYYPTTAFLFQSFGLRMLIPHTGPKGKKGRAAILRLNAKSGSVLCNMTLVLFRFRARDSNVGARLWLTRSLLSAASQFLVMGMSLPSQERAELLVASPSSVPQQYDKAS